MHNWSTNIRELKKDKVQYTIWRLEQLVNFGLGRSKLNKKALKKYWQRLHLDPKKKRYLEFLLWE